MPDHEVLEQVKRLRDADVIATPSPASRRSALTALEVEIARERDGHRRSAPRSRRRRLVIASAVAAGVCSAGGLGYASLSSPEKASAGVACHFDQQMDGTQAVASLDGRSALAICSQIWAHDPNFGPGVPQLQACVDPAGGRPVDVFRGQNAAVCARHGLRLDPTAGTDETDRRFVAFSRDIDTSFGSRTHCATQADARNLVRDALKRHGLTGWRIRGTDSSEGTCVELGFDSDLKTVFLVPAGGK